MKRLLAAFIILLIASPCLALDIGFLKRHGGGAAAAPTYLFTESFEGASDCSALETDTNCTNNWTSTAGAGTPDFTTTAGALEGTNSLNIGGGGARTLRNTTNFTTANPIYAYAIFTVPTYTAGTAEIITINDSSGASACGLGLRDSTGAKLCATAAGDVDCDTAASNGTTYHVWLEYQKSTGANDGFCKVYLSTDGTKGAVTSQRTSLVTTIDVVRTHINANATYTPNILIDKIRVDDVDIGSNPQ